MGKFTLRGSAENWWRHLVNSRASDGSGNLFNPPPSMEQEPIVFENSIQPVMLVDAAQLDANPIIEPIVINTAACYKKDGTETTATLPMYDNADVESFIRARYGEPSSTHVLGTLLSCTFAWYDNKTVDMRDYPDLDNPTTNSLYFRFPGTFLAVGGDAGAALYPTEVWGPTATGVFTVGQIAGLPSVLPIGAGKVPEAIVEFPSSLSVDKWATIRSSLILYPVQGLTPAMGVDSPDIDELTIVT